MPAELIDTHCHLTMLKDVELEDVFKRASEHGVNRAICIGASDGDKSAPEACALADKYSHIFATAGIHPHDAGSFIETKAIEPFVNHNKVLAVGETGLDFFRDWAPFDAQIELFKAHIELAKKVNKPLIIHCRDAGEKTLEVLKDHSADAVGGVFHCYAEDENFAAIVKEMNFLVSVTGNLTFKKADKLREAIKEIPLEQIMVETDAPFMAPEPHRGKQSEPMHVYYVAKKIAEIKDISFEEVCETTTRNAERLFGIS